MNTITLYFGIYSYRQNLSIKRLFFFYTEYTGAKYTVKPE